MLSHDVEIGVVVQNGHIVKKRIIRDQVVVRLTDGNAFKIVNPNGRIDQYRFSITLHAFRQGSPPKK